MNTRRLVLITAIASGLEYYDFIIYGLLSSYLAVAFFPADNSLVATLQTLFIFALGYFARPIGGIIFGWIGDRYGRKSGFLLSMLLIALSTFAIGVLPSYTAIGVTSTIAIVILRCIQGLAFGAELPGMTTFLCEHIRTKNRGLAFGLVMSGVSFGGAFGTFLIYCLAQTLSHKLMLQYGWRIPFILGGGLAVMNYLVRQKLQESPQFLQFISEQRKQTVAPIQLLLTKYFRQIITGIAFALLGACCIIFAIILPTFAKHFYRIPLTDMYFAITLGNVFSILVLPFFGALAERIGRLQLLIIGSILMITCSYAAFHLLVIGSMFSIIVFVIILQALIAALATSYLPLLTQLFPVEARFSGVAICYNLAFLIASVVPAVLMAAGFWPLLIAAGITLLASCYAMAIRFYGMAT